jgi:hypothetical protein
MNYSLFNKAYILRLSCRPLSPSLCPGAHRSASPALVVWGMAGAFRLFQWALGMPFNPVEFEIFSYSGVKIMFSRLKRSLIRPINSEDIISFSIYRSTQNLNSTAIFFERPLNVIPVEIMSI